MSRYPPEADEAQHRHYNDGQYFVNPHDVYDPFNPTPASYLPPPPPFLPPSTNQPTYQPTYSPYPSQSPPPPLPPPPGVNPAFASRIPSPPIPGPSTAPLLNYPPSQAPDLHPSSSIPSMRYRPSVPSMYDAPEDHDQDNGNIPLLNRPSSQARLRIPSNLDEEDEPVDDNRSESNVRYGRIPQRVPRRYKTLKKVE
jgi:chitin synthase